MSNKCLLGIFRIMAVLDGNFNVIVCFNFYTCFIEKNFLINRKFFKNYLKNNILNICGLFAIQNTFLWIGNIVKIYNYKSMRLFLHGGML